MLTRTNIIHILIAQLFVVTLFFWGYSQLSLRLDESQSLWQTSHTVSQLLTSLSQNVHVPLYHLTVHYWQSLFGNDIIVGRALSLIFLLLTIPVAFVQLRDIYSERTAYTFTLLLTLSPFIHWFTSEIRMYTMLMFLTILSQTTFLKLRQDPNKLRWVLYTVVAILGVYTHYFFNLVLLSQILFYLATARIYFQREHLYGFMLSGLATAMAFFPWIYKVLSAEDGLGNDPSLLGPTSIDFFNAFSHFIFGFQIDSVNSLILSLWPLIFILLLLSIRPRASISPETRYFILAAFLPLVVAFIASYIIQPLFLSRYLIVALPALYILITQSLQIFPDLFRQKVVAVLCMALFVASAVQLNGVDTPVKEEFASVSAILNAETTERDLIFLSASFVVYPINYYYHGPARITTLPKWNRYSGEELPGSLDRSQVRSHVTAESTHKDKLYVVYAYDQGYEDTVESYFSDNFTLLSERSFATGMKLQVYQDKSEQGVDS